MLGLVFVVVFSAAILLATRRLTRREGRRARVALRWSREDDRALAAYLDDAVQ